MGRPSSNGNTGVEGADLYKIALDSNLFTGLETYWLDLHSAPGRRQWWSDHTVMLDPDFRDYVEDRLQQREVRPLRETNPTFDPSRFSD